jgi:hypothetical protein
MSTHKMATTCREHKHRSHHWLRLHLTTLPHVCQLRSHGTQTNTMSQSQPGRSSTKARSKGAVQRHSPLAAPWYSWLMLN